ncbi:MAG: CTP-dependent riboflavin kinase [Acidilobaceae archaeon]|nr:CTP-dependent riboflavin kinase [Acidilobaceae archaeon]MCX8165221.1 CTP-dependent riboflavin kinase [Acidilobaceae archaeon]MDW7974263.1 DUF120 domain-containing protein [Sulfolobales archaeon]
MECHFVGRVFSGLGEGGFYVSIYSKLFRELLGISPYPGTLNLKLEEPEEFSRCLQLFKPLRVPPPEIPGARLGGVLVYGVELVRAPDLQAFLVRPEITVYRNDVAELLSPEHLRSALGLEDGSPLAFRLRSL